MTRRPVMLNILALVCVAALSSGITWHLSKKTDVVGGVALTRESLQSEVSKKEALKDSFVAEAAILLRDRKRMELLLLSKKYAEYESGSYLGESFYLRALKELNQPQEYADVIIGRAIACRMMIDALRQTLETYPLPINADKEVIEAFDQAKRYTAPAAGMGGMEDLTPPAPSVAP